VPEKPEESLKVIETFISKWYGVRTGPIAIIFGASEIWQKNRMYIVIRRLHGQMILKKFHGVKLRSFRDKVLWPITHSVASATALP
jgi:hypothetical protein